MPVCPYVPLVGLSGSCRAPLVSLGRKVSLPYGSSSLLTALLCLGMVVMYAVTCEGAVGYVGCVGRVLLRVGTVRFGESIGGRRVSVCVCFLVQGAVCVVLLDFGLLSSGFFRGQQEPRQERWGNQELVPCRQLILRSGSGRLFQLSLFRC